MQNKEALLIVAHGSKVAETDLIMKDYAAALSHKKPELKFSYCYLQLMDPDIHTAVASLYNEGIRQLKVFPFFIFNGNHIKEDIPEVLKEIQGQYPDLKMEFLANIGFDSKLVELMLERI